MGARTPSSHASSLSEKHIQALKSSLNQLNWMIHTWEGTVLLGEPPAKLINARDGIELVLEESGELESQKETPADATPPAE